MFNGCLHVCKGTKHKSHIIETTKEIDVSTTHLLDHMKLRYVWQKVRIDVTSLCTTSFGPIRRLNLLCIASNTHFVWHSALSRICRSMGRHFKPSVETLIVPPHKISCFYSKLHCFTRERHVRTHLCIGNGRSSYGVLERGLDGLCALWLRKRKHEEIKVT